jgi:hypothetical protein
MGNLLAPFEVEIDLQALFELKFYLKTWFQMEIENLQGCFKVEIFNLQAWYEVEMCEPAPIKLLALLKFLDFIKNLKIIMYLQLWKKKHLWLCF